MVYILISKRGDCTVIFLPYANAVSSDNENAVNHGMRQITYVQTRTVIFSFNYLSVSFTKIVYHNAKGEKRAFLRFYSSCRLFEYLR